MSKAGALPDIALSIRQPWAWLIVNGHKDVENRTWPTNYRGPVLIHAGVQMDKDAWCALEAGEHPVTGAEFDAKLPETWGAPSWPRLNCGGIVGVADLIDVVRASPSPWFVGTHGFVLRNARPLPFRPLKGQLGFFSVSQAGSSAQDLFG